MFFVLWSTICGLEKSGLMNWFLNLRFRQVLKLDSLLFFTIRRKLLESSNLHNTVSNIRITYFSEAMLLIQYAVKHNLGISINQVLSISWFPYRKQRNFNKFNPQVTTEPRS